MEKSLTELDRIKAASTDILESTEERRTGQDRTGQMMKTIWQLEKDINEINEDSLRLNSEIDRIKNQTSELRILNGQSNA